MFAPSSSPALRVLVWGALLVLGAAIFVLMLGQPSRAQESDAHPTPDPTHPRVARYLAAKAVSPHASSNLVSGLARRIGAGQSDDFQVRVSSLDPDANYRYSVLLTANGGGIGFNEGCSWTLGVVTVPAGSTSHSARLTLYACRVGTYELVVELYEYILDEGDEVILETESHTVEVTSIPPPPPPTDTPEPPPPTDTPTSPPPTPTRTPTPTQSPTPTRIPSPTIEIAGLVHELEVGQRDSFTLSASNLASTHTYSIQIAASNGDIGFNASCSDLATTASIPSGRTSHHLTVTLHGCHTTGGTVTVTLRRENTAVDTASQQVRVKQPSVRITGLVTTMGENGSDPFTVSVSSLVSPNTYTIRVTTGNNLGLNRGCTDTQDDVPVPAGSTSHSEAFTLHGCTYPGGAMTASLHRGGRTVAVASHSVSVASSDVEIAGLATTIEAGRSDPFTVSASNLSTSDSYTIRVTTNSDDVGFNASCSDREDEVSVPSGSTSHSATLTLYGCDVGGGTVSAELRRGLSTIITVSHHVSVTDPCFNVRVVPNPRGNLGLVSDCGVLMDAKAVLEGTAEGHGTLNWSYSEITSWDGITISGSHSRVTKLELNHRQLSGSIPSTLGELAALTQLRLHKNALTGAIPPELGDLPNLTHLSLNGNQLTGGIPSSLGDLSHLTHLWLKDNRLTGEIPASLEGLGLAEARLSGNQLTGCIPNAWRNVHDNDFVETALSLCTPAGEVTLRASDTYLPVKTRVTLAAAADPSTGIRSYEWQKTWGDGIVGPWRTASRLGTGASATAVFQAAGPRAFRVKVTYSNGEVIYSDPLGVHWRERPPAPTGVTVSWQEAGLLVAWDEVPGASVYEVLYREHESDVEWDTKRVQGRLWATLSELECDTNYDLAVKSGRVLGDNEEELWSDESSVAQESAPDCFAPVAVLFDFRGELDAKRVGVTSARAGATTYHRITVPSDTGLQVNQTGQCDWSMPTTTQSEWLPLAGSAVLVRCSLGTEDAHVQIEAKNGRSGASRPVPVSPNFAVPHPWHRNDSEVTYKITQPLQKGLDNGIATLITEAIGDAAAVWNDAEVEITVTPADADDSSPDVVIKVYTGEYIGESTNDQTCGDSIACTYAGERPYFGSEGVYPHIGRKQPFWIENPPRWHNDDPLAWTINYDKFMEMEGYQYLPSVLVHEFGHTGGMGHSVIEGDIMYGSVRDVSPICVTNEANNRLCGLSNNDRNGMIQLNQSHGH